MSDDAALFDKGLPIRRAVLGPGYRLEIDLSGIMRGDYAARWAAHKIAVEAGILTRDEVRQVEGYNARGDGDRPADPVLA